MVHFIRSERKTKLTKAIIYCITQLLIDKVYEEFNAIVATALYDELEDIRSSN
jgi:hypothetical protein